MVAVRRDLHRHPELSWHEERTAGRVAARLAELGIACSRPLPTAVVAELPAGGFQGEPGRAAGVTAVALRADLDALPIGEETGLEFASSNPGVMHACGHDGHTAMLLGAAELLAAEGELAAPVRLLFQPAEEKAEGARALIEAGALDGVGAVFGGHLDPRYPTGSLVVTPGAVNASTDSFTVRLAGRGAHAARPHEGVDAVVAAAQLVVALQTLVARENNPAHPAVVTVGVLHAGSASNVLAAEAELAGTVRALDEGVRQRLLDGVRRVAAGVATAHRVEATVDFSAGLPPVVNREPWLELARRAAEGVAGAANVVPLTDANLGAEDFACYLERLPGCFIRYGARPDGREPQPAHSSRFDIDERALAFGAAWLAAVARDAGERLAAAPPASRG